MATFPVNRACMHGNDLCLVQVNGACIHGDDHSWIVPVNRA